MNIDSRKIKSGTFFHFKKFRYFLLKKKHKADKTFCKEKHLRHQAFREKLRAQKTSFVKHGQFLRGNNTLYSSQKISIIR